MTLSPNKMKKYILFLIPLFFLLSCAPQLEEIIEDTHPDGTPRLIAYYQDVDGQKEKVKVAAFYEDGSKRYVGEFLGEKRNGYWIYWYENGNTRGI